MRCGDGSTALSKCLFRPLGHQQPQFPFSFYFLIYWFGYCRRVRALLSMNLIPQTERVCHFPPTTFQEHRENCFIIIITIFFFKWSNYFFFLMLGDFFYLHWVYLCSREIQEKEKGKGAETRSCMMQERPDELVIRCEKLTSCVTRWTWWSKKQGKMKKTCVFNTVVSH